MTNRTNKSLLGRRVDIDEILRLRTKVAQAGTRSRVVGSPLP